MSLSKSFMRRAVAVGAASALGLGGLLVASPATAAGTSPAFELDGEAVAAAAEALVAANDSIQGAAVNAAGELVVFAVANPGAERTSVEATVGADGQGDIDNIVYLAAPATAVASTDVVGGAGYFAGDVSTKEGGLCSVGFSAWTAEGKNAVITAGHCDVAETPATTLTVPSGDPAGQGSAVQFGPAIGNFAFSQFGGPGSTTGASGNLDSIDIGVIDVTNNALNLKPEVTDWTSVADLSASTTKITAVGNAVAGATASKSGRTTGVKTGTINYLDGWLQVDDRFVHGFAVIDALAVAGDSGGPVYSGTTAIGITSATAKVTDGTTVHDMTWAADLQNALTYTDGYTVKLFIEAPVVTTPNASEVLSGASVTGTAPAGTTVTVTPASGAPFEATMTADGAWSFPAPSALGTYDFTVQAKSGKFDTSEIVESSVKVVPAPLLAPAITNPADGAQLTADVTTLTGTGLPGATVTVAGDATGTATVAADGTFSVTLSDLLSYGNHELTVTQASEGQTSPAASTKFAVVLESPAVTSPAPGSSFPLADAPTTVSGTGIDGAIVTVSIDGVVVGEAEVVDGVWALKLEDAIIAGTHTVTVTQALEEASSAAVSTTFSVVAPVVPGDNPGNGDDGGLAETGVESLGFIGGAAALLLAGGLILVMRRRITTA